MAVCFFPIMFLSSFDNRQASSHRLRLRRTLQVLILLVLVSKLSGDSDTLAFYDQCLAGWLRMIPSSSILTHRLTPERTDKRLWWTAEWQFFRMLAAALVVVLVVLGSSGNVGISQILPVPASCLREDPLVCERISGSGRGSPRNPRTAALLNLHSHCPSHPHHHHRIFHAIIIHQWSAW